MSTSLDVSRYLIDLGHVLLELAQCMVRTKNDGPFQEQAVAPNKMETLRYQYYLMQ